MKHAAVSKKIRHFCHDAPKHVTRPRYRALLMIAGVLLLVVHRVCPDYEITVTLLIHSMVTLDPTV